MEEGKQKRTSGPIFQRQQQEQSSTTITTARKQFAIKATNSRETQKTKNKTSKQGTFS